MKLMAMLFLMLQWRNVLPFGSGAFPEQWRTGKVPLALQPTADDRGRLWLVGGPGVWQSSDALHWARVTTDLPWGERYGIETVWFNGELWALGGEENRLKRNEVFHSADGKTWTRAPRPLWTARRWHTATVFDNRLWIIGGSDSDDRNDVWVSADGAHWKEVTANAQWPARGRHTTIVWKDHLCVVGGWSAGRSFNDIWCSRDGKGWRALTRDAPWSKRVGAGVSVFNDAIWVFGGSQDGVTDDAAWLNDVWTSKDGAHWELQTLHAPWSPRAPEYHVLFKNRLWIIGGKGIEENGRGGYADDVWSLSQ